MVGGGPRGFARRAITCCGCSLADYFGLDVRRTHLEYVGARKPEAMKLDDTRLMGDLQGPEVRTTRNRGD